MESSSKKQSEDNSDSKEEAISKEVKKSELMDLFEEQLKDILWAEEALIKAMPKMIESAASDDLVLALADHLEQSLDQITRLDKVFKSIDKKPSTVKCYAMEGLIEEAREMLKDNKPGPKCDAGIIAAAQKIEHYEIASYGTLREFAETLGLTEAEKLLMEILNEEKAADQKLTEVALQGVNLEAASEQS